MGPSLAERLLEARARLLERVHTLDLEGILRATLDEGEALTGSCIGFYHFLDADQETLHLQAWSTRTEAQFCRAEGKGQHYPVSRAGVWADCVRQGCPIIHNDYASLPDRKGLPPGHAEVLRELVVPVHRDGRIVAILGVGNKPSPYDDRDLDAVQRLADLAWDLAERKLRESERLRREEELDLIFRTNPDLILLVDQEGRIQKANPAWERVLGLNLEALAGTRFMDYLHPEDLVPTAEAMAVLAGGGEVIDFVNRYRHGIDGSYRWLQWRATPRGRLIYAAARDITAQRAAESEVRAREERHRSMLQAAQDGVWLVDPEGRFLEVNEAAARMLGYSVPEMLTLRVADVEVREGEAEVRAHAERVLRQGWDRFETLHRHRDGSEVPVEVSVSAIPDTERLVVFVRDDRGRRAALAAAQGERRRFLDLVNTVDGIVWEADAHTFAFTFVGQRAVTLLGHSIEDWKVPGFWVEHLHPEDREHAVTFCVACTGRLEPHDFEYRFQAADGRYVWLRDIVTVVAEGGEPRWLRGVMIDITAQKAAGAALQASERRLNLVLEGTGAAFWDWDMAADEVVYSPQWATMLGYAPEELPSGLAAWRMLAHPEDLERSDWLVQEHLAGQTPHYDCECRMRHKDGRWVWILDRGAVVARDGAGRPLRMVGSHLDITARKEAQLALKASEARFRRAFDVSPDGIALTRLRDGVVLEMNRGMQAMTGYAPAEVLGRSSLPGDLGFWVHERDRRRITAKLREKGEVLAYEAPFRRKDGSTFFGTMSAAQVDLDGEACVLSITRDMTERRRWEGALQESESRLRTVTENAPDTILLVDPEGRIGFVNHLIPGLREEDVLGSSILEWVPEAQRPLVQGVLGEVFRLGERREYESTGPGPDGAVREYNVRVQPVMIEGVATGAVYTATDITDLKRATEALRSSEARFRSLVHAMPDILFELDADGLLLSCETSDPSQLLLPPEDFLGRCFVDVLPPDAANHFAEGLRLAAESGVSRHVTYHLEIQGERRWFDLSCSRMGMEPGRFLAVVRDISDLKRAEDALRASEARLTTVMTHAPDFIQQLSLEGRMLYINRIQPGLKEDEVIGSDWLDYLPEEGQRVAQAALREALATRGQVEFEVEGAGPFGTLSWYRSRLSPVLEGGGVTSFILFTTDITRERLAAEERRRLETQLLRAQKMESLGSLAGGVAHDMNNVLGAILGLASAHRGSQVEGSPLARAFDTISKACERGRTLVRGLLDFARQDLAETKVLDLNTLVREEAALLERTTLQRVRLVLDLAPDLRMVQGDPGALSHALMNLCVNAVDAMAVGGELRIRTANVGTGLLELVVQDSGSGMSPEVLERALDPFFTTKPQGKGTGLGLPMVYSTVKAHQGTLDLRSVPGQGTTVAIRLPACSPADLPTLAEVSAAETRAHPALRVLLVDDDELVRSSLEAQLDLLGHQVVAVGSGEAALEALAGGLKVDLVLLDMNMPGLGGAGTLPRLAEGYPGLPVLLATGRADQDALDLSRAYHATILAKPFSLDELERALATL